MLGLFCPIASGSKGNCSVLGSSKTKVLIDVGIGPKSLIKELNQLNIDISEISAILITHEHSDHISGLKSIVDKYKIPILCNLETAKGIVSNLGPLPNFKIFTTGETFEWLDLQIHPFSIQHDTADPVGFSITVADHKIGICTDLGQFTSLVVKQLQNCKTLFVESNHEPELVLSSKRPPIYKQRVLGRMGHLSNEACSQLIQLCSHSHLKNIFLAHLSEECNRPELAFEIAKKATLNWSHAPDIHLALQKQAATCIRF